jgi:hypothetical protein
MTRARALKHAIRARAAKTGERYTTARRHVLKSPPPTGAQHLRPVPPAVDRDRTSSPAHAPAARPMTRGGLSDAKARERTGHGLDHWFAVLDRFGAVEKGHTQSARHLHAAHGVPGWYAQGITVAYERARGVRAANQRCDGEFEVSVSKVINAPPPDVVGALTDPVRRRAWTASIERGLAHAIASALDDPRGKGIVVRADGQARFRFKWGDTTVQIYMLPKGADKVSFVVTNLKLASAAMVDERRAVWRAAVEALAKAWSAPRRTSPARRKRATTH